MYNSYTYFFHTHIHHTEITRYIRKQHPISKNWQKQQTTERTTKHFRYYNQQLGVPNLGQRTAELGNLLKELENMKNDIDLKKNTIKILELKKLNL